MAEDFAASNSTPRNACLDGVSSSDGLVAVIGSRGGWVAPSGKLVVEEEVDEAAKKQRDIFVFVQDVARDADAERLVVVLSNYVDGKFRKLFRGPQELEQLVHAAVARSCAEEAEVSLVEMNQRIADPSRDPFTFQQEASVRYVLATERNEPVFDPVTFETAKFEHLVNEVAHAGPTPLFQYKHAKRSAVTPESYEITQEPGRGSEVPGSHARIELRERGVIVIDVSVTGGREPERGLVIVELDVAAVLQSAFSFSSQLVARIDPYQRHRRFGYNVLLHNGGYRMLVPHRTPGSSYAMRMSGDDNVIAYSEPRLISISDLRAADAEVERALSMLRRRYKG